MLCRKAVGTSLLGREPPFIGPILHTERATDQKCESCPCYSDLQIAQYMARFVVSPSLDPPSRNRLLKTGSQCTELACLGAFLAGVLAALMARSVEIEPPILVLSTVWRAGAPIMKLNGKSW